MTKNTFRPAARWIDNFSVLKVDRRHSVNQAVTLRWGMSASRQNAHTQIQAQVLECLDSTDSGETHLCLRLQTHTMVVTIMMTATKTRTTIRIIHLVSVKKKQKKNMKLKKTELIKSSK